MEMLFRNVVWLTALVFVFTGRAFAAQPVAKVMPGQKVDGSFVREWLVLGPFPAKGLETDFLADVGGEANVRPREGDTVVRRDGTRLTWTRLRATSDNVSLEKALGIQQWAVAYAYCELVSDQQCDTDVRAANEGNGASVRLNGEIVGTLPPHVDRNLDIHALLPIRLQAGRNPCLIKSAVAQREWTFVFQPLPPDRAEIELTVTDPAGKNVAGAQVEFYEHNLVTRLKTDPTGQAIACFYPSAKSYDLRVTSGEMGAWLFGVTLQSGERRRLA